MKCDPALELRSNVVEFRNCGGISSTLMARLHKKCQEHGISAILPFPVEKIIVKNWVNMKCRYGCSKYGTSWCCPPATPEPEKARAILSEYTTALLLTGHRQCADFYLDNCRKRTGMVRYWKGIISTERLLFLEGYYKAFALVSGVCSLCKKCAYPDPCRFPQEKRPMIESFSIDVIGTLRNLGATSHVAVSTGEAFNYHGIILLE
jgi:predicted metal-binding protein